MTTLEMIALIFLGAVIALVLWLCVRNKRTLRLVLHFINEHPDHFERLPNQFGLVFAIWVPLSIKFWEKRLGV